MTAKNEYYNFVMGTTKEKIKFEFDLEGSHDDIDFIDYGSCPCTKGSYSRSKNKITGKLDLSMVGVSSQTPGGEKYITKYIKIYLGPGIPERVKASDLPKKHPMYSEGSFKSVINPKKEIITLTIAGDAKYEK